MSDRQNRTLNVGCGTSPAFLVFLLFLGLKLTGHIDWSWWWVTSPLWIPAGFIVVLFFIVALGTGIFFGTVAAWDFYEQRKTLKRMKVRRKEKLSKKD